jgi:hypothetical protein
MSTGTGKAKCKHTQWTTDKVTGVKMCTDCGTDLAKHPKCNHALAKIVIENGMTKTQCEKCGVIVTEGPVQSVKVPLGYEKRLLPIPNVRPVGQWVKEGFGAFQPKTRQQAQILIDEWNEACQTNGMKVEYRLPVVNVDLRCKKCDTLVNETYKGDVCLSCHLQEKMAMAKEPKVSKSNPDFDIYGMPVWKTKNKPAFNVNSTPAKPVTKKPTLMVVPKAPVVHTEGDIWELPHVNAPFMSKQWAYQGSASTPYVITHYQTKRDGAVTKDGWACSCMNFTRKTPRTECKHILKTMMKNGTKPTADAKLAAVPDETLKAFQKWQREQAAAGVPVGAGVGAEKGKLNMFENKGRKIR